jgi:cytochrome P450
VGKENFLIEEGMTVCANLWSMHTDKENWGEDALEFIPER